ncbi:cytochrome b/b6 domain-containing protein, partial [Bradyrhizobium sp.]|uniref:cytochrome b/b6 domain-containing protein n=1 Tax=Bradyrhizobium sp. TaxID=376 RepID=UPI003C422D51
MRDRKTDYGTIILHWLVVGALGVAFLSGMRIATETPDRLWINLFDAVLPRESVWTIHMQAAVALVAVAIAYFVYLVRSGLTRRVRLDNIRMRGLFGRTEARLGAVNVVLCWIFFIAMLLLMVSGGLLYFDFFSGHDVAAVHWYSTWVILAFAALHILIHFKIGGLSQLLRIFRPTILPPQPKQLDAVELLMMLAERSAPRAPEAGPADARATRPHSEVQPSSDGQAREHAQASVGVTRTAARAQHGASRQRSTLQSNPFVVAAAVAIVGTSFMLAADRFAVDRLEVHRIDSADAPRLDGDSSDRAWRNAVPFFVTTTGGGNFDARGETRIEIRAVHDDTWAYFLFIWEDSTRSLKHLPLVKGPDGWRILHDGLEIGDEHDFHEDKFSVLLTASDATLAGDRTFHASP